MTMGWRLWAAARLGPIPAAAAKTAIWRRVRLLALILSILRGERYSGRAG